MAVKKRCRYPHLAQVLGGAIAQKRKDVGWSQDRLAAECGRTRNCIQQCEDYEHIPDLDTLLLIFEALGYTPLKVVRLTVSAMVAFRMDLLEQTQKEEECVSQQKDRALQVPR